MQIAMCVTPSVPTARSTESSGHRTRIRPVTASPQTAALAPGRYKVTNSRFGGRMGPPHSKRSKTAAGSSTSMARAGCALAQPASSARPRSVPNLVLKLLQDENTLKRNRPSSFRFTRRPRATRETRSRPGRNSPAIRRSSRPISPGQIGRSAKRSPHGRRAPKAGRPRNARRPLPAKILPYARMLSLSAIACTPVEEPRITAILVSLAHRADTVRIEGARWRASSNS